MTHRHSPEPVWALLPRLARAMATLSCKTGELRRYALARRRINTPYTSSPGLTRRPKSCRKRHVEIWVTGSRR
jgi:hypothetical protein